MKEEKNKKVVSSKPKKSSVKKTTNKTPVKKVVEKKSTSKSNVKKAIAKKSVPTKTIVKKEQTKKKNIKIEKKCEWKQYFYYIALLLIFMILLIGIWDISTFYQFNNTNTSYLMSSRVIRKNNNLVLRHAKENFSKMNGGYFVYVSYTGSDSVYSLERKIKKIIKEYNIADKFYYVNVDSLKTDESRLQKINYYLNLKDAKITEVPTIYYVNNDNEVVYNNIITREDGKMMEIGDFQKLLDINGFTKK